MQAAKIRFISALDTTIKSNTWPPANVKYPRYFKQLAWSSIGFCRAVGNSAFKTNYSTYEFGKLIDSDVLAANEEGPIEAHERTAKHLQAES